MELVWYGSRVLNSVPSRSTAWKTVPPKTSTLTHLAGLESWDNIAAHFIDSILDGKPCAAPLRHGLIVQQMMEALLLSAETGKEARTRD